MKHMVSILLACMLCYGGWVGNAQAVFNFTTPDAPLAAATDPGLNARLWSGDNSGIGPVDLLAQARTYIANNPESSLFISTVVDYPNGSSGSTLTTTTLNSALGVDAASLTNPAIGTNAVLNSIIQLTGFLRIENANTVLNLGVGSDDGSELLIQGTQVINNDGIHAFPGVGSQQVTFALPGLYAMELLFFESQVVEWGLEFYYLDNAGGRAPVPADMLVRGAVPEPAGFITWGLLGAVGSAVGFRRLRRRPA